jgi:hypothetical protein
MQSNSVNKSRYTMQRYKLTNVDTCSMPKVGCGVTQIQCGAKNIPNVGCGVTHTQCGTKSMPNVGCGVTHTQCSTINMPKVGCKVICK